jgi:hypothetical protein
MNTEPKPADYNGNGGAFCTDYVRWYIDGQDENEALIAFADEKACEVWLHYIGF